MKPSVIVWDLETVPDIGGFAAANDLVGKSDAEVREAIGEIFHEDALYCQRNGIYRGRDEIDRIASVIKATHPDFRYQPIAPPEDWAMVVGSDGCRVALAWCRLTPGLASSLPRTAGLPPSITFSTSYTEMS